MTTAIVHDVALMLVRRHLAATRYYPHLVEGEHGLADALRESCISVQHAEETLRVFDDDCPTPRQLKDAAYAAKERYLPRVDLVEQWKAEGATYGPVPAPAVDQTAEQKRDQMLRAVAKRLGVSWNLLHEVGWNAIYAAMQDLGYPLNRYQREMIGGYTLPARKVEPESITQADIDREKQKSNNNGGVA